MPDFTLAAELQKPYQPVDYNQAATSSYKLADLQNDYADKQKERQSVDVIQKYMEAGGDMSTPDGVSRAVKDLNGKITPKMYEQIVEMHNNMDSHVLNIREKMAQLGPEEVKAMDAAQELQDRHLKPAVDTYMAAIKENPDNKAGALADYQAAMSAQVQLLTQPGPNGQPPVLTPEKAASMLKMTPEAMNSNMEGSKWLMTQNKLVADTKLAEARAKALGQRLNDDKTLTTMADVIASGRGSMPDMTNMTKADMAQFRNIMAQRHPNVNLNLGKVNLRAEQDAADVASGKMTPNVLESQMATGQRPLPSSGVKLSPQGTAKQLSPTSTTTSESEGDATVRRMAMDQARTRAGETTTKELAKEYESMHATIGNIKNLLSQGNSASDKLAQGEITALMERARNTNMMFGQFSGVGGIIQRVGNFITKGLTGKYSTKTRTDIADMVGVLDRDIVMPRLTEMSEPILGQKKTETGNKSTKEGAKSKSKSGKPMVYRNGQWEYE